MVGVPNSHFVGFLKGINKEIQKKTRTSYRNGDNLI